MKTASRVHRGYMMVEMTCALGLLGTFGLVATHLFVSTVKVLHNNPNSTEAAIRFDAAVKVLRADIAAAQTVELQNEHSLMLQKAGGMSIQWDFGPQFFSREADGSDRTWGVSEQFKVKQDSEIVLLGTSDTANEAADIAFATHVKKTAE